MGRASGGQNGRTNDQVGRGRSQIVEAIPPHLSLIVHSIMTRKESKVIVMIALGSLFFWRQRDQENPFGLHFLFSGVF